MSVVIPEKRIIRPRATSNASVRLPTCESPLTQPSPPPSTRTASRWTSFVVSVILRSRSCTSCGDWSNTNGRAQPSPKKWPPVGGEGRRRGLLPSTATVATSDRAAGRDLALPDLALLARVARLHAATPRHRRVHRHAVPHRVSAGALSNDVLRVTRRTRRLRPRRRGCLPLLRRVLPLAWSMAHRLLPLPRRQPLVLRMCRCATLRRRPLLTSFLRRLLAGPRR